MDVIEVPGIAGALVFRPTSAPGRARVLLAHLRPRCGEGRPGLDPDAFVQDSISRSRRGVVRGMHIRSGAGEAKLVRCSYGEVFDVVIDLRPGSPTYRNREVFDLTGDNQVTVYVPAGCAHGFQALTEPADVSYRIDRAARPVRGRLDRVRRSGPGHSLAAAGHADVRPGQGGALARSGHCEADMTTIVRQLRSRPNKRLQDLIPGGAHTYAKGEDQYPEDMAPVISHGSGAHVWDVDGNEYIEYGSGLRAVSLGHAHPKVVEAVRRELDRGTNFVRPSIIELEAAERFLTSVPTAEMVKFAKNGSDATTAAVKLARAVTGRPLVALCSDQRVLLDRRLVHRPDADVGRHPR